MKKRPYLFSLSLISVVILLVLGIQIYWNYKNYQIEKRQFINEVQTVFNDAIDDYYIELGKNSTVGFFTTSKNTVLSSPKFDTVISTIFPKGKIPNIKNIAPSSIKNINIVKGSTAITQYKKMSEQTVQTPEDSSTIKSFVSSIIISIQLDSLLLNELNQHIDHNLAAKELDVDYGYVFKSKKDSTQIYRSEIVKKAALSTVASSAYFPNGSVFNVYFDNIVFAILRRNLLGIGLSSFLVGSVILCLFWLLRIIRQQKELAALKNDLISNITHEFKTPISTINVALEGMQHFNPTQDLEKNKKYLQTSSTQLKKLSLMVEKLLETATLDSNELQLDKEETELTKLLENLVNKHKSLAIKKSFSITYDRFPINIRVDIFHFENALNNLLDNAVKYGGNEISVTLKTEKEHIEITVEDNGTALTPEQAKHLFEKFYRVSRGNRHDVKGFGIGLYYTQKIIEKHGGNIALTLKNSTRFVVQFPYE